MKTRGRPRSDSIERFNIATNLLSSKRFIRFRMALGVGEKEAVLIIMRFWWFVAENCAFDPVINRDDSDIIADFCWYESGEKLVAALMLSGFVDQDGSVHKWFVHQPLADTIASDRKRKTPINPEFSTEKDGKGTPKESSQRKEKKSIDPPTPLLSGQSETDAVESVPNPFAKPSKNGKVSESEALTDRLVAAIRKAGKGVQPEDRDCLKRYVTAAMVYGFKESVCRVIGETEEGCNARNPIAVVMAKLKVMRPDNTT